MKIVLIDVRKYSIPLVRPLSVAGRDVESRSGIIVSLTDETGQTGHGEAAPLPGLHKETLADVCSELTSLRRRYALNCEPRMILEASHDMSSCSRTAIEMAMFDLHAQKSGAASLLPGGRIPVSGLVMAADESLHEEVETMISEGYLSIKVNVGRRAIADDIRTIEQLRTVVGGRAGIRLDANRSWGLDDATAFCRKIGPKGIDYLEEPLVDISRYPAFWDATDVPVALDETLAEVGIDGLEQWERAAAFVIKPSLLGGFAWTGEFIARALENDVRPVMSSAFESDLSLRAYARFAALFHMFDTPMGLDTLKWFSEPLLNEGFEIINGHVAIESLAQINLRTELLQEA